MSPESFDVSPYFLRSIQAVGISTESFDVSDSTSRLSIAIDMSPESFDEFPLLLADQF